MALLVLQGGTMPATRDLPEQRFEHSPHRHIPEDVIVNATARPAHEVELSDSTAKAPSWIQQPLDVFTTAAGTVLEILNKWLHYANRGRALEEFEAKVARAQARALAAAEILLREIGPRVSRYLPPLDRPVCVAEVEAPTWHEWCAEAARAVLRRAFPPNQAWGTSRGTALLDPSQSMPEVRVGWLGEINQSDLRRVSKGTMFEYSGAWKRVEQQALPEAVAATKQTLRRVPPPDEKVREMALRALAEGHEFATFSELAKHCGISARHETMSRLLGGKAGLAKRVRTEGIYRIVLTDAGQKEAAKLKPAV